MGKWLIKIFASFFYLGYSPVAPGTAGTFGGIILFYFLTKFSPFIYVSFLIGFIILSLWVSTKASCMYKEADPRQVVVDEVCGYLVTMVFITSSLMNIIIGFFLFRFFDIVKPPPARSSERLPGGVGIVADDVVAGIYANIILQVVTRVV